MFENPLNLPLYGGIPKKGYISRPENKLATTNMIDNNLAIVVHTPRCTVNHTMRTSPGSMMFNRDTMVNFPFISNLIAI